MAIDRSTLTRDLKALQRKLSQALFALHGESESVITAWAVAAQAGRTAETRIDFAQAEMDQAAAHWILGCVFLRMLEDNALIPGRWLAAPDPAGQDLVGLTYAEFYRANPVASDGDYLLAGFSRVAWLEAGERLYDSDHNPIYRYDLPAEAARGLREFWTRRDPVSGALIHDFTDPDWDTRFLGDLYQDLSELARDRYALLQTPDFVEDFILGRSLNAALASGVARPETVTIIDPACGSGHFLLGAFARLLALAAPAGGQESDAALVKQVLSRIGGVDLNPFAVAITVFRLTLAAAKAMGCTSLQEVPALPLKIACGDSLLHTTQMEFQAVVREVHGRRRNADSHCHTHENLPGLLEILHRRWHVVVANPPYITCRDKALNDAYRQRWSSCHRQFSLVCPFVECCFNLAQPGGQVGLIVANSFTKREFGSTLIEDVLARRVDLSTIVDTSGAYIPGHGTPTIILFGRHQAPGRNPVRAVLGIKGEPSAPAVAAKGLVWQAILAQVDQPASESAFVSSADVERSTLARHPWSLGGGGAQALLLIINSKRLVLAQMAQEIGFSVVTREDELFILDCPTLARKAIDPDYRRAVVAGDEVRDFALATEPGAIWPYSERSLLAESDAPLIRLLWPYKAGLSRRVAYGLTQLQRGLAWFEYSMFFRDRYRIPLSITFAFVATHNHFVLDRGGKVFNRSAPVIKLPEGAREDAHLDLLGLLNSSTACFWGKQVLFNKGGDHVGTDGARVVKTPWEDRLEWDATKLQQFPLASPAPRAFARRLDQLGQIQASLRPAALIRSLGETPPSEPQPEPLQPILQAAAAALADPRSVQPDRPWLLQAEALSRTIRRAMITLQEEMDWHVYRLYGVLADDRLEHLDPDTLLPRDPHAALPPLEFGQRAFEIRMARQMQAGTLETRWFERHGAEPSPDLRPDWPEAYRDLVERRIEAIGRSRNLALIERPDCKRRWHGQGESWAEQRRAALTGWLADRMEAPRHWPRDLPLVRTSADLTAALAADPAFYATAALLEGRPDPDLRRLVEDLVQAGSVPLAPAARFSADGLLKRREWEAVWDLQRREDAGEAGLQIPVPPKYKPTDYAHPRFHKLRGSLDVPRERFLSLPGAVRKADASLPILWAGYDHLQQGQAIAGWVQALIDTDDAGAERILPALAALLDLVPWIRQWHGAEHADEFAEFLAELSRNLGLGRNDPAGWRPAAAPSRRGRRRA